MAKSLVVRGQYSVKYLNLTVLCIVSWNENVKAAANSCLPNVSQLSIF